MKLKDIFNIDLSTRGGVKLYRKIMGKYNIPKQDSKQLVKEIRNSSEGGGAKEWYYSVDVEKMTQDLNINNAEMKIAMLNTINIYIPTAYLIAAGYGDSYNISERTSIDLNSAFFFDRLKAIKLSNTSCIEIADGNSGTFSIFRCYDNLEERNKMISDFGMLELVEHLKPYITEISKEEYYNMIQIPIFEFNK